MAKHTLLSEHPSPPIRYIESMNILNGSSAQAHLSVADDDIKVKIQEVPRFPRRIKALDNSQVRTIIRYGDTIS